MPLVEQGISNIHLSRRLKVDSVHILYEVCCTPTLVFVCVLDSVKVMEQLSCNCNVGKHAAALKPSFLFVGTYSTELEKCLSQCELTCSTNLL